MESSEPIVYNKDLEAIVGRLKVLLIWPKSNRPEDINAIFYLKIIIFYGLIFGPCYFEFNVMSMSMDLLIIIEDLSLNGGFWIHLLTLKTVVGSLNHSNLDQYLTYNKYDRILRVIQLGTDSATVLAAGYRYFTKAFCLSENPVKTSIGVCGYLRPVQYPFNFDRPPFSEIILLYQAAITCLILRLASYCMILLKFFVDKAVANLKNVQIKARNINKNKMWDNVALEKALKELAKDHNDVIREVRNLNYIVKYQILVYFVMGSMIISLMLLCVFVTKMNKLDNILRIIIWLGSFYIMTRYCQVIIDEGEKVAVVLYETKWYEMSLKNQKLVYVLLIAAQQPLAVHAGPFQEMSLASFLAWMKATYSYLNLLLNTL